MLIAAGRTKKAIEQLDDLVRGDPRSAERHDEYAWVVALAPGLSPRDYVVAVQHARKAVELEPEDGDVYSTLALAEYRAGHWAESIAAAHRSEALIKEGHPVNWFILALAALAKR